MVTLQRDCHKCGKSCILMSTGRMTRGAAEKDIQELIDKCEENEENGTERPDS